MDLDAFRAKSPRYRVGLASLAGEGGFCLGCPTKAFDARHFFLECPRFRVERQRFMKGLCCHLRGRQVSLDQILTCGMDSIPRNPVKIAELVSQYILQALGVASRRRISFQSC